VSYRRIVLKQREWERNAEEEEDEDGEKGKKEVSEEKKTQ